MKTQIQQIFQDNLKQEDSFAQEFYKMVRKMAKKYEKFENAYSKGHKLSEDEEEKKEALKKSLEDHIEIFELYKKHHNDKENNEVVAL